MKRTDLINHFIRSRGYRSYVEIGVNNVAENFDLVECPRKCGVDPAPGLAGVDYRMTSDDFFRRCPKSFDLIFVDGLHEEEQAGRDIRNALDHLKPGGVVVIHDCLPPAAWYQRPFAEFRPGELWNGTVWKAVLRHFAACPWECFIVDCDWGCGVIDTAAPRTMPRVTVSGQLDYDEHFRMLRPFVRPVSDFSNPARARP